MKTAIVFLCGIFTGALTQTGAAQWEIEKGLETPSKAKVVKVKKSLSGLCHSIDSQYYGYLKYYIEYDNLTQCVLEGGRLPTRVKNDVKFNDNYRDNDTDNSITTRP